MTEGNFKLLTLKIEIFKLITLDKKVVIKVETLTEIKVVMKIKVDTVEEAKIEVEEVEEEVEETNTLLSLETYPLKLLKIQLKDTSKTVEQ